MTLDAASLIAEAERDTRLSDWGDDAYFAPRFFEFFKAFAHALNQESQLHARGRRGAELRLRSILEARLHLVESRKREPALSTIRIARPIFIMGLARTGSTTLQFLMAQDAQNRMPQTWEMLYPGPPPEADTPPQDPRILKTLEIFDTIGLAGPEVQGLHPSGALKVDECQWIMDLMLPSGNSTGCWSLPAVNRIRRPAEDTVMALRFHHIVMQNLVARHPGKQVVLKSPGHLFHLEELLEIYPDALFVQTHRDPAKVIPSLSALLVAMRRCSSDAPQNHEKIAMINLKASKLGVEKTMALRRDPALNARFIDLHFTDFIADPVAAVHTIYEKIGLNFTDQARGAMQSWLADPANRPPKGHHMLAQYGLDEAAIDEAFGDYMRAYGIRPER